MTSVEDLREQHRPPYRIKENRMNIQHQSIWQYFTLPIITKLRNRLASINHLTTINPNNEQPKVAVKNLIVGIMRECNISVDEVSKCYEEHFPVDSGKVVLKTVDIDGPESDDEGQEDTVFDDELHALESVGLPSDEDELNNKKKKDILKSIYSDSEVVEYLCLPDTKKECDTKFTKAKLIKFIFEEGDK